ncbi:hypothetical protein HDC92_003387 [Pedobacter sp. AK017]|uniref:polysaccharide lyase family 8 super-sandwich domain-containing protein n=1 Tax=Pedobacter sp. AK017 TaxID=2723073 RepID=UPI001617FBFE|nr:polysaccharide lyase family 8 super-sandwich domain-containing protein [Pedobacter sp. AK017]MBB5439691.1 hypothetical protein [Pedobacter sp. AK017]
MARRLFIIILLIQLVPTGVASAFGQHKSSPQVWAKDIKTITERLAEDYLAEGVDYHKVEAVVSSLKQDGSWPGIDYVTVSNDFPAGLHLKKLMLMANAYARQGSGFYRNKELRQKILLGYNYYLDKKPTSKNWWYNDIGAQQDYMAGLILMKGQIANADLIRYASYLKDLTDNPAHRGMNRIWVSAITIAKGCLENDYLLVGKGFQSVAATLVIANEQGIEGIKTDNSFHQHRPQLYSGGYGMGFAESTAKLMALSANTSFHATFSAEKKRIFSDLLLYGHQLFSYRGAVDFGTIGRNIARPNSISPISLVTLDQMMVIDSQRKSAFRDWKSHIQGAAFPKPFLGSRYFWKSDIMTYHGEDYYLSAKVISTRTNGTEMLNAENLKGYNLPLGATNIMKTGGEYKNIFPIWDWTRVPGTTAVMNQSATVLPWYLFGTNEFAGGISNGEAGVIAYEHSYNGVQAKKAYFFVDGSMLCLGAGINAIRTQQVVTSVNQCYQDGEVVTGGKGNVEGTRFTDSLSTSKGVELHWVYHAGVGYIFPAGGNLTLKNAVQTGSWKSINQSGSEELISKPVFSLWLNHGTAPSEDSYCYIVRPERSLESFKSHVHANGFIILKNDKNIQAVKYGHSYFVVFYKPGAVDLGKNLQVSSDSKAVFMMEEKEDGYQLSLADPTHQQKEANLSFSLLKDAAAPSQENGTTRLNFIFPQGDDQGSAVNRFYKK